MNFNQFAVTEVSSVIPNREGQLGEIVEEL